MLNFRYKMLLLPGLRQLTLSYYERKVPGMGYRIAAQRNEPCLFGIDLKDVEPFLF